MAEKLAKQDNPLLFQPLVVDVFGAWDPAALNFIKKLAATISLNKGTVYSVTCGYLLQNLSVTLQRCNAHAILRRRSDRDLKPHDPG